MVEKQLHLNFHHKLVLQHVTLNRLFLHSLQSKESVSLNMNRLKNLSKLSLPETLPHRKITQPCTKVVSFFNVWLIIRTSVYSMFDRCFLAFACSKFAATFCKNSCRHRLIDNSWRRILILGLLLTDRNIKFVRLPIHNSRFFLLFKILYFLRFDFPRFTFLSRQAAQNFEIIFVFRIFYIVFIFSSCPQALCVAYFIGYGEILHNMLFVRLALNVGLIGRTCLFARFVKVGRNLRGTTIFRIQNLHFRAIFDLIKNIDLGSIHIDSFPKNGARHRSLIGLVKGDVV